MVSDNGEQGQEPKHLCNDCKWFNVILVSPPPQQVGLGSCMNQHEDAPYASILAHFAGPCETWEKRPEQKIVTPPTSVVNKLKKDRGLIL